MKKYEWILFDADETLFHFDAFRGLQLMFANFGVQFSQEDYNVYQLVNKSLWVDYQNALISAEDLKHRRFQLWANTLEKSTVELNSAFLAAMAEICLPLEGAVNLLDKLRGNVKLCIITNGFTDLQEARLHRNGLRSHIDLLVISEEVGFAKPHKGIFDYALANMGNPDPKKVLIVGDTPESDIIGGINAGFDTCWLNTGTKILPKEIQPTFEVSSLRELEILLLNEAT